MQATLAQPELVTTPRITVESDQLVYIALPHRPTGEPLTGKRRIIRPTQRGQYKANLSAMSLLNKSFNCHWEYARNQGLPWTHFAMKHDDINPAPLWVDTLIDEMNTTGADIVSTVIAIKDERGLTSTGIRNCHTGQIRRLTMTEVMRLPETFGIDDVIDAGITLPEGDEILIVNTGLWVCKWDQSWVNRFPGFRSLDGIVNLPDGRCKAVTLSEDWWFSEWATRRGLKIRATRKVSAIHTDGVRDFPNDRAWGTFTEDLGDDEIKVI